MSPADNTSVPFRHTMTWSPAKKDFKAVGQKTFSEILHSIYPIHLAQLWRSRRKLFWFFTLYSLEIFLKEESRSLAKSHLTRVIKNA